MHKIIIFLIGLTAISTVYAVNPFTSFQVATTSLTSNAILQSSDGTFSKWIAPNTSTSTMFLTQASGTAPYWSSLPTTAIFIPYVGATTNTDLGVFGLTTSGYLNATTSRFTFASSSSLTVTGQTILAGTSGNVGVGTTSPFAKLAIQAQIGDTNTFLFTIASSSPGATSTLLSVRNASVFNTLDVTGGIRSIGTASGFYASNVASGLYWQNSLSSIIGDGATGGTTNYIAFNTNSLERARFDSNGNFGIGTNAPTALLTVSSSTATGTSRLFSIATSSTILNVMANGNIAIGSASAAFKLDILTQAQTTDGLRVSGTDNHYAMLRGSMGNGNNNPIVQAGDSGIIFSSNTVDNGSFVIAPWATVLSGIRMTANGYVGVGTSTPTSLLTVSSSTATGTSKLLSIATSSELFTVLANGRVGIGIGAPLSILHLFGGVGNTQILFTNSTTGSGSGAYIGQLGGNDLFNVNQTSTGKIYFGTGNTTRLTVDNLGNFGVGTTTPTGLLTSASSTIANTGKLFSVSKITELFTILGNGFVGIGTTTPQASLIVATSSIGEIEYDWTTGTSTNMSVDFVGVRKQQRMMISTAAQSITILPMYNGANGRLVVCNPGADSAGATTFYSSTTIKVFTTQTTTAGNCMFWSFNQTAGSSSPIIAVYGNVL